MVNRSAIFLSTNLNSSTEEEEEEEEEAINEETLTEWSTCRRTEIILEVHHQEGGSEGRLSYRVFLDHSHRSQL